MSTNREIVYQSEHLVVVHAEHGSTTVIVTFNEMGMKAKGDDFWGGDLLDKMKVTGIGFVSTAPNWYPMLDMLNAIAVVRQRTAGRRLVTYGFSQGGYGALKFSRQLGAAFALGFSPQWSINPDDVGGWDKRFMAHYDPLLRNGERIEQEDLCARNFIFVDRTDVGDGLNADRLMALEDIASVTTPFTSHATVRVISEGGAGRALIERCLDEKPVTSLELRNLIRSSRMRSRTYTAEKVRRLVRSAERHGRFLDTAVGAMVDGPEKNLIRVGIHTARRDLEQAEEILGGLSDDDLLRVNFMEYWQSFRSRGFVAGERRLAPLYKVRYENDLFQRLHGVNSLIHVGEGEAALDELRELSRHGGAAQFVDHFITFYKQVGRLDLAADFVNGLIAGDATARPHRIRIGFDLARAYQKAELRSSLYRELESLREVCAGRPDDLLKVADYYDSLGESSFALQVVDNVVVAAEHRLWFDMAVAKYSARIDPQRANRVLQDLLNQSEGDAKFWLDLSYVAEQVLGPAAACQAARRAVTVTQGQDDTSRHRLAYLLCASVQWREALWELRQLLKRQSANTEQAARYAALAARCKDTDLALAFTAKWMKAQPQNPDAGISYLQTVLNAQRRREARAIILSLISDIERGDLKPTALQFAKFMEQCKRLEPTLEYRVGRLAVAAHPTDERFEAFAVQGEFAAKFFGPSTASVAKARRRLISRFLLSRTS